MRLVLVLGLWTALARGLAGNMAVSNNAFFADLVLFVDGYKNAVLPHVPDDAQPKLKTVKHHKPTEKYESDGDSKDSNSDSESSSNSDSGSDSDSSDSDCNPEKSGSDSDSDSEDSDDEKPLERSKAEPEVQPAQPTASVDPSEKEVRLNLAADALCDTDFVLSLNWRPLQAKQKIKKKLLYLPTKLKRKVKLGLKKTLEAGRTALVKGQDKEASLEAQVFEIQVEAQSAKRPERPEAIEFNSPSLQAREKETGRFLHAAARPKELQQAQDPQHKEAQKPVENHVPLTTSEPRTVLENQDTGPASSDLVSDAEPVSVPDSATTPGASPSSRPRLALQGLTLEGPARPGPARPQYVLVDSAVLVNLVCAHMHNDFQSRPQQPGKSVEVQVTLVAPRPSRLHTLFFPAAYESLALVLGAHICLVGLTLTLALLV